MISGISATLFLLSFQAGAYLGHVETSDLCTWVEKVGWGFLCSFDNQDRGKASEMPDTFFFLCHSFFLPLPNSSFFFFFNFLAKQNLLKFCCCLVTKSTSSL